jgi:hypothetical protein
LRENIDAADGNGDGDSDGEEVVTTDSVMDGSSTRGDDALPSFAGSEADAAGVGNFLPVRSAKGMEEHQFMEEEAVNNNTAPVDHLMAGLRMASSSRQNSEADGNGTLIPSSSSPLISRKRTIRL